MRPASAGRGRRRVGSPVPAAAVALAAVLLAAAWTAAGPAPSPARAAASVPGVGAAAPASADTTYDPFVRPPREVLEARRHRLLDSLGTGAAVIPSATRKDLEASYPQASDFRQDNDFLYYTGLETPDSWLVVVARGGGDGRALLFVPGRDTAQERWTGPRPGPERARRISGIETVRTTAEFERRVRGGSVSGLARGGALRVPLGEDALADPLLRKLVADAPGPVRDLGPLQAQIRLVKDDFGLRMLRRAIRVTDRSVASAMARAEPGVWEHELEAVVEYGFRSRGAERVGFPGIVGSGPNAVILHYDRNRRKTGAGDLVVMDVGAEYSYYTADVTRTFPVSGSFTDRQRALYELVLGAQEAALEAVRPGNTLADVDRAARAHLREHSDGLCGERSCDAYFSHGIGHWLGMDVHDVGSYGTAFAPGMVLTVEPGVYLPGERLGIRIEDDVLVTADGHQVLSSAPKSVEAVEAAVEGSWRPNP